MYIEIRKSIAYGLMLGVILGYGCGRKSSDNTSGPSGEASDTIPGSVKELVKAVTDNDSTSFARLVSYPLQRPYPLHDIESEEEMRGYYACIVDDSLRNKISKSASHDWQQQGWRGWTLENGQYVWANESVYDIPYVSTYERHAIDSLSRSEIESIPESIRNGWKPVLCLLDTSTGQIMRIDERTDADNESDTDFRLALYPKADHLRDIPSRLLAGHRDIAGSATTVSFIFTDDMGEEIVIEPDAPDTGTPVMYLSGDSVVALKRAYWHELVSTSH